MTRSFLLIGLLASTAACGSSTNSGTTSGAEGTQGASLTGSTTTTATSSANAATTGGQTTGGSTMGNASTTSSGTTASAVTGNTTATGSTSSGGATAGAVTTGDATTGGGAGGVTGSGGASTSAGAGSGQSSAGGVGGGGGNGGIGQSNCMGDAFPTANPAAAGPFQVMAEKNVGPLAGVVPDPIYGEEQQRFNVYRPQNLADSGYCHPILIWANGFRDNPEQNPPECVVDSGSNQWCGQYLPMLNHLASHGFVVVAPLSTATAEGDPLPTTAGLDWILEQAEDSSSPYYQRLDTLNIGQLGHSYGGMSTCMSASDPRYRALATICGTRALDGVHTPMLFFCGEQDDTVKCAGVRDTFLSVTDQPAFFLNELAADHGSWVYTGPSGVSLSAAAAWFRVHLMNDTANRNYFYGGGCKFCTDNRVQVEQNSLMAD